MGLVGGSASISGDISASGVLGHRGAWTDEVDGAGEGCRGRGLVLGDVGRLFDEFDEIVDEGLRCGAGDGAGVGFVGDGASVPGEQTRLEICGLALGVDDGAISGRGDGLDETRARGCGRGVMGGIGTKRNGLGDAGGNE